MSSFAQTDSLRREILNYRESKTETIGKGRRLLLEKFLEGDKQKVQEIFRYLVENEEDEDYLAFYPHEKLLLYYWTEQYSPILKGLANFDSVITATVNTQIRPREDMLYPKLAGYFLEMRAEIKSKIHFSDLSESEKELLKLNLDYLLTDSNQPSEAQEDLNVQANKFLADYPNTKYEDYIRKNIRIQLSPSKCGYAFEFFSGYGFFTENLESNFKNSIPMGIAFDIDYKRYVLYLRNYIGFSKTKNNIPFESGTWVKDAQARVFLPEASFGYTLLDNKYVKLVPFIGISSADISPTTHDLEKIPEYENVGLSFTTTYTSGLNLDLKLGETNNAMLNYGPEQSYWFARIRYSYNSPQFSGKYTGFNGNFHSITIGIGGFGRALRRDY